MLDLNRLAAVLTRSHDGIVRGDQAREQVTEIVQPIIQKLMASGLSQSQAITKMLADHR